MSIQDVILPFLPRVIHVGKYYRPVKGGIENHCYHLCTRLAKYVDLTVVVSATGWRTTVETVDGVKVVRVPRYAEIASTPISPGFFSYLRRADADIVHVHVPNPMAAAAVLAARPRGKLIVMYHSDIIRQKRLFELYRGIDEAFLSRAEAIIATAPENVEHSPVLSRFRDKTRVIPLGVEPGDFEMTPRREERVRELRERFGPRVVFFVGRHVYYKGIDHLIRAMKGVDAHLVLGSDGPLTPELGRLTRSLGLSSRVTFAGRIADEDLPCFYHASDIFCLPSVARSEAFGIVQLEAMACGVPVVSTRLTTGVVYVNQDGVTGVTVPPADSAALTGALNRLLGDKALRRKLGRQGRERVHREFTHDINARRTLELYAEVLSRKQVRAR
jgi:rhamnosyl/mannosyltransferase